MAESGFPAGLVLKGDASFRERDGPAMALPGSASLGTSTTGLLPSAGAPFASYVPSSPSASSEDAYGAGNLSDASSSNGGAGPVSSAGSGLGPGAKPPAVPDKHTFCCATDKAIQTYYTTWAGRARPQAGSSDGPPAEPAPPESLEAASTTPPHGDIPNLISIPESLKQTDMGGASFYTYVIRAQTPEAHVLLDTKHRYSEFESLRKLMQAMHPYLVVPPIPEKHSITDYAVKQSKAKDDPYMIDKRKRMLQTFMNRMAKHPVLGREHLFHRFLTEGSWNDILGQSGYAHLIKKKKNAIQKVIEKQTPRTPNQQFQSAESYTERFSKQINQTYLINKRLLKHSTELSTTYSELGHLYNSFSLSENELAPLIEKIGASYDETVLVHSQLIHGIEEVFTEPLQEYSQYSKIIDKILKSRLRRQIEYETICETLVAKQALLTTLERSETDAQRLAAILNAEGVGSPPSAFGAGAHHAPHSGLGAPPSSSSPQPTGIMATLNSLIDNDPELTRRNNISKTRDRILGLEEDKLKKSQELKEANVDCQEDLNRFQLEKVKDLRKMLINYAKAMRDYHAKVEKVWRDVLPEIAQIQD